MNSLNQTVLITGASGFIGQNIRSTLKRYNFVALSISKYNDIRKLGDEVKRVIEHNNISTILHFGANPSPQAGGDELLRDNFLKTVAIAGAAPKCRMVFASTINVYGHDDLAKGVTEKTPVAPETLYAASKAASEVYLSSLVPRDNLFILRLCATIGRNMTHGFLHALVNKIKKSMENNMYDQIELYGTSPGVFKPYTHVDAVSRFCSLILSDKVEAGIYNIAPSDNMSIEAAFQLARQHVWGKYGEQVSAKWIPSPLKNDPQFIKINNTKYLSALGMNREFDSSTKNMKQAIEENI